MKKQIFKSLFLVLITSVATGTSVVAQNTVQWDVDGKPYLQQTTFLNPEQIKELMNYRLPSWGYSDFYISGNSSGIFSDNNNLKILNYTTSNSNLSNGLNLDPSFRIYRESELRTISLVSSLGIKLSNYSGNRTTDTQHSSISKGTNEVADKNWQNSFTPKLAGTYHKYNTEESNVFWIGQIEGLANFNTEKEKRSSKYQLNDSLMQADDHSSKTKTNSYELKLNVGYGKGRIRNVTPTMLAIRFQDRAESLGKTISRETAATQKLARQFARGSGYAQTGFRNSKFFWRDVFAASGLTGNLSPYEVQYLSETGDELATGRWEGTRWRITPTAYMSRSSYDRDFYYSGWDPEDGNSIATSMYYDVGMVFKREYYHNPSLNKQIHSVFELTYFRKNAFDLDSSPIEKGNLFIATYTRGLMRQIADRMVLKTSGTMQSSYWKTGEVPVEGALFTSHSLSYFVERGTSISLSINTRNQWRTNDSFDHLTRVSNYVYWFSIQHFFGSSFW